MKCATSAPRVALLVPSLALAGAPRGLAVGFFSLEGGRVDAAAPAGWTLPPGSTIVLITTAKNKSTQVKEWWISSKAIYIFLLGVMHTSVWSVTSRTVLSNFHSDDYS